MNIKSAQLDMRQGYFGGGPGAAISGLIWLGSGIIAILAAQQTSLIFFFFGGMFIHPLGMLLSKLFGRAGKHTKNNPLATLAMESTILLFIGLFIAYTSYLTKPEYFFSIMLMVIGGRYLIFQSIYGMRIYWIFGLVLIIAGAGCLLSNQPFHIGAIVGGIIELIFAPLLVQSEKRMTTE